MLCPSCLLLAAAIPLCGSEHRTSRTDDGTENGRGPHNGKPPEKNQTISDEMNYYRPIIVLEVRLASPVNHGEEVRRQTVLPNGKPTKLEWTKLNDKQRWTAEGKSHRKNTKAMNTNRLSAFRMKIRIIIICALETFSVADIWAHH